MLGPCYLIQNLLVLLFWCILRSPLPRCIDLLCSLIIEFKCFQYMQLLCIQCTFDLQLSLTFANNLIIFVCNPILFRSLSLILSKYAGNRILILMLSSFNFLCSCYFAATLRRRQSWLNFLDFYLLHILCFLRPNTSSDMESSIIFHA